MVKHKCPWTLQIIHRQLWNLNQYLGVVKLPWIFNKQYEIKAKPNIVLPILSIH